VRMQVIMTLHENLQLCPKLHKVYLNKDKTLLSLNLVQSLKLKDLYFGFLNLNPKAML
jgi:hypothetical protein